MERSLLYVSRRLATADDVQDIVAVSRARNAQWQVTGALIASRGRFAQILEGQRSAVDALMDSIPIVEHLDRMTPEFATAWYHWFFFAQPDIPERVIGADPDAWYGGDPAVMGEENFAERRAAVHRPEVVRAMLEDYRAGLTVDRADEEADRAAGRRLTQPVLALWSSRDDLEELFGDPLAIWPAWADDLTGHPIDSGHHMAEEAPAALTTALADFFRAR